jgi:hypothetical protein
MTIHLAPMLPSTSSDLPGNSDGPPSSVPLFGLAPGGVYLAPSVTGGTGELLPHPFTLTRHSASPRRDSECIVLGQHSTMIPFICTDEEAECRAVSFLWHFPSRCRDWALPSALSCGARTFLPLTQMVRQRPFVLLRHTR